MSILADIRKAQRTASDPGRSIWVRANAGSGKTRVLVERILRILLDGTPPDRVLALTFTKAAAAEMKERLFTTLGAWTALDDASLIKALKELEGHEPDDDKLKRARRLFARALETPGGLKVQTIHGFCQAMLERFPIEAGVPPHFDVLDDALGAELRAEAKATVLSTLGSGDAGVIHALGRVIEEVGEMQFDDVVDTLLGNPALLRRSLQHDPAGRRLRKTLNLADGLTPETLDQDFLDGVPLSFMRDTAKAMIDTGQKKMSERGEVLAAFTADPNLETLPTYTRLFVTQKGEPAAPTTLVGKKVANHEHVLSLMLTEQDRVLSYLDALRSFATLERTQALQTLGHAILTLYDRMKATRGVLDYEDLILAAADLLERGADWVLYKLDQGIDHILVDEAQDTSPDQWRVISALAHEFFTGEGARTDRLRTVFAVGDEKQSIYSFQGADPRGFALTQDTMADAAHSAGLRFDAVSLPVSFRSAPPILEFVDEVAAAPAIRASLSHDDLDVVHTPFRDGHAGMVELWPLIEADDDPKDDPWDVPLDAISTRDPKARLAGRIAKTIRHWLDTGARLEARDRPITPGDILVLVNRRSSIVDPLVRALKAEGVPVSGTDRIKVIEELAVMDLMAAAQFALLPSDDLTLANLLKSPLIGLTETDLYALSYGRTGSLWEAVQHSDFTGEKQWLDQLIKAARRLRPADFFQHIVSVMGGRKKLAGRLGTQVHDPVDEFLVLARAHEEQNAPSLQSFLHWVKDAGSEIKRDMERGSQEVRIMTAHGAKGLEANIVILPDMMSPPSTNPRPKHIYRLGDEAHPLFVWARRKDSDDSVTAHARQAVQQSDFEEYCRLLYVALTRARDRLVLCGFAGKKKLSEPGWYDLVQPAMAALGSESETRFADGETGTIWRYQTDQTADVIVETTDDPASSKADAPAWLFASAPPEPAPSRPLTPSRALMADPPARSPLQTSSGGGAGGEARQRGTLIHRLLELLPDCTPKARAELGRQFLDRSAPDLDAALKQGWLTEVLAILDDPAFAHVFAPGSLAEVPVSGLVTELGEGLVLSGQIDRLSITDTEILLVDFKTNRPPPDNIDDVAEAYLIQMASYRAALRAIYPGHTIRAGLLWTDAPRLMELPATLLDQAEIRARAAVNSAAP